MTTPAAPAAAAPLLWEDLPFANRFVVWAMRLWLTASGEADTAHRRADAFDRAGGAAASAKLDTLMAAIADGAGRAIALAPIHSPWLTADEAHLMDAVAIAQCPGVDPLLVLRPLLAPRACRRVRQPLVAFAAALGDAGLALRCPDGDRAIAPRPAAPADPAARTRSGVAP